MILIKTKEDIYPAIEELIVYCETISKPDIVSVLKHRMYKVSWTTQTELFEELDKILREFIKKEKRNLDGLISNQIEKILEIIK